MGSYYNEIDPYCAQWLQNLMDAGHIPAGVIDPRSIEDVRPDELHDYTQCHFFAGIGGWPLALALAGWPADRPVWTGSCPCQPFSAAGKGHGFADERHLWPAWQHLIAQCRPPVIFGEQVASKDAEPWLDLVHADLEGMGYAFGCVPFPAAGIGAPHIRERNYWVADAHGARLEGWGALRQRADQCVAGSHGVACGLEHAMQLGWQRRQAPSLGHDDDRQASERSKSKYGACEPSAHWIHQHAAHTLDGFWRASDWLCCTDGKFRPVEPGTQPLAHGIPKRMEQLRAYGNAIVPQAAQAFIDAYLAAREPRHA
jgi:DNA (cytosine-5)-methyltransferase 1